eukprot:GEMP01030241.1.p1 GENE.GEMP01030241.1~~GEMP01030241.1.p1  ORF type:complete len:118 (+),score=26.44 GEMP01030241.1:440-793(+)
MGGMRQLHPSFFTRYIFGFISTWQVANFVAEQEYGISRVKDPNITWPWWQELMQRKRKGEVPDVPGYMFAKYRNDAENRWAEKYHFPETEIIENRGNLGDTSLHFQLKRSISTGRMQ